MGDAVVIERCETSNGEIQLQRRGSHYEIISNGTFIMSTYNGKSEKALVKSALSASFAPEKVLIGGLGVGYSVAEALRDDRVEAVTIIEIESKVIEWNKTYLAGFSDNALDHPKTDIVHTNLIEWIFDIIGREDRYDVICLDIDNGPEWTVYEKNFELYHQSGLESLSRLLKHNGIVSFWSSSAAPQFLERLKRNFISVEVLTVEQERGEPDYIYVARKKM